ncbi:hypothetical protein Tco_0520184 [Tanacetum coccineum]
MAWNVIACLYGMDVITFLHDMVDKLAFIAWLLACFRGMDEKVSEIGSKARKVHILEQARMLIMLCTFDYLAMDVEKLAIESDSRMVALSEVCVSLSYGMVMVSMFSGRVEERLGRQLKPQKGFAGVPRTRPASKGH